MRANSQQVGFCFRHTFIYSLFCNICFISYSQICAFFAIYSSIRRLQWFQRGWQWPNAGRRGGSEEERKGEGKRGREGGREGKDRKESERGRKSALGERGARSTCTLYERNPRRRRWAVVHFMHDSARLYWIPCTPTLDYPEYHARLRSIILSTMHPSDWFFYIRFTIRTDLLDFLWK